MYPKNSGIFCFNTPESLATMAAFPNATLVYTSTDYLIYLWVAQSSTDDDNLSTLFNTAGQPGYPFAGCQLAPPPPA